MMLEEILEIPGNRRVFEDLRGLLAESKAIAFVGAGASAGLYPLWGDLIRQLCDQAVAGGFASEADRTFWLSHADTKPAQVVRSLKQKLTSPQLGVLLRNIFGPKPAGGPRYTPTHAVLMRVPFSGYITTNYDPGLIEARLVERPAVTAVGWSTWQDSDEFDSWRDPARLADPYWCPVLFAHGFYQRSDTIVLGIEEYRRAYQEHDSWRRLFEQLWSSAHLAFVGFGFSDPFLDFIVGEVVKSSRQAATDGRHIAFMGLRADEPYSEESRRFFLENYNVRLILYPVAGRDHSALLTLLDALSSRPPLRAPAASPSPSSAVFPSRWMHATTDDDKFKGREENCIRLSRWVEDKAVRVVGVTALGGTGKTALVGHWLRKTSDWNRRPFAGLFAWSFYQERDSAIFLRALLEWAHETFRIPKKPVKKDLVSGALALLQAHPLIVVLDGLEVLQEGPEEGSHGTFLDGNLRELLGGLCAREHGSLAVLTSRLAFTDLERYLGTAFQQLELAGLTPEEGAALLADLGVSGTEEEREEVSRRLEGHPLGLRLFAEVLPASQREHPNLFFDQAFSTGQLAPSSPLAGKVRRLLAFYQKKLPTLQVQLLGIVALFRTPVAESTILRLADGLFGKSTGSQSKAALLKELQKLHHRKVLTREPIRGGYGYACHPILRDHFRAAFLETGGSIARRTADLLKGQPYEEEPRTAKEIEPVLLAIELLLDAGEFQAADDLYRNRLSDGSLFNWIPALSEGLQCASGFIRDEQRRKTCAEKLSKRRLRFYLNEAGMFASLSGKYELANLFYTDRIALAQEMKDAESLSVGLQNKAVLSVRLGNLKEAIKLAKEALELARSLKDDLQIIFSQTQLGWARALSGQVKEAAADFANANALEKRLHFRELHGFRGVQWAELFLRTGHFSRAEQYIAANFRFCESQHWKEEVARCRWAQGLCALANKRLKKAEAELRQAEAIFHSGQMLFELARTHIAAGSVALERGDLDSALHQAGEALALAQPRGMRLVHSDALLLRGRARLLKAASQGDSPGTSPLLMSALNDASDAFHLARDCNYVWAESSALSLQAEIRESLAKVHEALGDVFASQQQRDAARQALRKAKILSARLKLTAAELQKIDDKIDE